MLLFVRGGEAGDGGGVSEKLEYVPASFHVIQTRRVKRACPKGHELSVAPPVQAVEKSLAAEGLLAHVVVSNFADHLPLHRQEGILGRQRVRLPRSMLGGWVADVAEAHFPIVEHMKEELLRTDYLQTDDTPVALKKLAGSFKGRLWAYLGPLGGGRWSTTRHQPTNGQGPRRSSQASEAVFRRTPARGTTRSTRPAVSPTWAAGPTGGAVSGRPWIQSCRLAGIDPFLYFRDVLQRVPNHPQRLIGQLTPRAWAETFAKTVAA